MTLNRDLLVICLQSSLGVCRKIFQGFNYWHGVLQPSSIADAAEVCSKPESVNDRCVGMQRDEKLNLVAYAEHLL
jgi:hypothetical protein